MSRSTSTGDEILVRGARVHNLKNITVRIPHQTLTVITGPSGSGKSSLAFETIHAEGQRRYIETFSTYARQFLDQVEKPDVDELQGLSPTIAIVQKTTSQNPRSTVGTVTEVHDHLRVLYSRISQAECPNCAKPIQSLSLQRIVDQILGKPQGAKIILYSPIARQKKGEFQKELLGLRQRGFTRVRINGEIKDLSDPIKLEKTYKHTIEVSVDRLIIKSSDTGLLARVTDAVQTALQLSKGLITLSVDGQESLISQKFACPDCDVSLPEPEPRIFSFNSPLGACKTCEGLGYEEIFEDAETDSAENSDDPPVYLRDVVCKACKGARLSPESLAFKINKKSIAEVGDLAISDLPRFIEGVDLSDRDKAIVGILVKDLQDRLQFLNQVGVGYLNLNRTLRTLSGGESQRIRLASQLGSQLVGITYVLDEPSIGLHPRDNHLLIESLKKLRDRGNTVIVVEHDEETMREANHVIDIGPGAGVHGGNVVFEGDSKTLLATKSSLTAQYLRKEKQVNLGRAPRPVNPKQTLRITGATLNNLKNITLDLPLGLFVTLTGISGSGKSSLIMDTLYPLLLRHFYKSDVGEIPGKITHGLQHLDKVIQIDQRPIGRTPRSNPATYTGIFGPLRSLFALLPESQLRAFKPGRFSFNVKGGRCDACDGDGIKKISMNFMPDTFVPCLECKGTRYKSDTLQVYFKGKNIAEVLALSVEEATGFFSAIPAIYDKLKVLNDVGLGYLTLGQSATTLSGGEAQRIKLAKELSKRSTGKTLYILDEPSTGLHFEDIRKLMDLLHRLVDQGNSVVVIEHNTDMIKGSDYIIDLGPEGGAAGGEIVATGTPAEIKKNKTSRIAGFL